MSSLFNLTEKYKTVLQLAEEGADESAIKDALEHIDDQIEDKADGYAAVIKHLENNMELIDKENQRLDKLKKTHNNTIQRMKDNLMDSLKATDKKKLKTDLNKFTIRKNQMSLVVEREDNIPQEYYRVEKKLDRKALKEYLKEHQDEQLDGVGLRQSESLSIR